MNTEGYRDSTYPKFAKHKLVNRESNQHFRGDAMAVETLMGPGGFREHAPSGEWSGGCWPPAAL